MTLFKEVILIQLLMLRNWLHSFIWFLSVIITIIFRFPLLNISKKRLLGLILKKTNNNDYILNVTVHADTIILWFQLIIINKQKLHNEIEVQHNMTEGCYFSCNFFHFLFFLSKKFPSCQNVFWIESMKRRCRRWYFARQQTNRSKRLHSRSIF